MTAIKVKQRLPPHIETPFKECKTPPQHRAELIEHLNTALILEHATIPPYLCALYSIKEGANKASAQRIRSVVMEEMLHMVLVANLSNSIGGSPSIAHENFIPEYPDYLPNSDRSVEVSLNRFSPKAIQVFLDIERPKDPQTKAKHEHYSSIGQFYAAIKDELDFFCHEFGEEKLFVGDPALQVSPNVYYSGGGEVVTVTDYESARRAIKVIVDEGEGFGHSIFSGDHEQFGERKDLAHYFKFNEIEVGRSYLPTDSPARDPSGSRIEVDLSKDAVHPAVFKKTVDEYPKLVRSELEEFNRTYSHLLRAIDNGFRIKGQRRKSKHFQKAVILMNEVKYQMIKLMTIPVTSGHTAGPTFFYVNE